MRALPLFGRLILDGRVPDVPPVTLRPLIPTAGAGPVTLPVVYCARCSTQLVRHWYAAGVEQGGPVRLLCLFCVPAEPGPVHPLTSDAAEVDRQPRCTIREGGNFRGPVAAQCSGAAGGCPHCVNQAAGRVVRSVRLS